MRNQSLVRSQDLYGLRLRRPLRRGEGRPSGPLRFRSVSRCGVRLVGGGRLKLFQDTSYSKVQSHFSLSGEGHGWESTQSGGGNCAEGDREGTTTRGGWGFSFKENIGVEGLVRDSHPVPNKKLPRSLITIQDPCSRCALGRTTRSRTSKRSKNVSSTRYRVYNHAKVGIDGDRRTM